MVGFFTPGVSKLWLQHHPRAARFAPGADLPRRAHHAALSVLQRTSAEPPGWGVACACVAGSSLVRRWFVRVIGGWTGWVRSLQGLESLDPLHHEHDGLLVMQNGES